MAIFEFNSNQIVRIQETTFDESKLRERHDLQRLLRAQIEVIAPDTLIIAEEFGEWEDSKRRIDLLGLDKDANLVVIELKRTEDGGHMELQAVRYAAMVSTMTFKKVVELYAHWLTRQGKNEDSRTNILSFLGWEEPNENRFAQDVRIILVAADFSKELTTAVMWMNERDLDIRCIRIKPYKDGERLLVDVQQVIPLPEAAAYQVQIKEKGQEVRQERSAERYTLRREFWKGLLRLAEQKTDLHANISPGEWHTVSAGSGLRGVSYQYVIRQHSSGVMLYIDRGAGDPGANKKIFDTLFSFQNDIERAFGGPLIWERLDGKQASVIRYDLMQGGWKDDQPRWAAVQDAMVDIMIRFEKAIGPHLTRLKGHSL